MKRVFAVIRTRSKGWKPDLPLEGQDDWRAHAEFMDALWDDGVVLLAGPLEGTPNVLIVIRAEDEKEIHSRLSEDCWTQKDLLTTTQITPWTLRLGSL
jgi:hypothetical protein